MSPGRFLDSRQPETALDSQRIYDGRVVKLDVDRVLLAGGREVCREVVRHPGAVVILPLLPDGRLVLVRQFRYAVGEVLWELPAGTLEPTAESVLVCAQRELEEETGYRAQKMTRMGEFFSTPGFSDECMQVFLAEGLQPTAQRLEPDEAISVAVFAWEEVEAMVRRGRIRDAKTLAALHLWSRR